MKKLYLGVFAIIACTHFSYAQNTFPSSGSVGIGTTSPGNTLDVNGGINTNGTSSINGFTFNLVNTYYRQLRAPGYNFDILSGDGNSKFSLPYNNDEPAYFHNYGLVIDGNVGIGTSNPGYKLDVANNIRIGAQGGNDYTLISGGSGFGSQIQMFYADGSENIRLTGNNDSWLNAYHGNVGIGTTSPLDVLNVNATANSTGISVTGSGPNIGVTVAGATNNYLNLFRSSTGNYNTIGFYTGSTRNYIIEQNTNGVLNIGRSGNNDLVINSSGSIGIGTTDNANWQLANSTYKLAVGGSVIAEQVTVKLQANWPDYVFKPNYTLTPLSELKTYIDQNHHLPEIPSEKEVAEKGLNLGEMNKLLTKKVEELTLYLIEKDKELKEQQDQMKKLEQRLELLEKNQQK